jgi:hypothetical protein
MFYSNYMIVLGGRGEDIDLHGQGMPVEVYDTDKLDWSSHLFFDKFRHAAITVDKYAFVQGGCDFSNPTEPSDKIVMFDMQELCVIVKKYLNCMLIILENNRGRLFR